MRIILLCGGYFVSYVGTGLCVKYFTAIADPRLSQLTYLIQNTIGSSAVVIAVVASLGWFGRAWPVLRSKESWPVGVAGLCTAIIIPATTLLYLLPVSVMAAMVLMRAAVIIVSRCVDWVQKRQGISRRQVSFEENAAVVCALIGLIWNLPTIEQRHLEVFRNDVALVILAAYVCAYGVRIYIMNYYKNSAAKLKLDNAIYFAVEQTWASAAMALVLGGVVVFAQGSHATEGPVWETSQAVAHWDWRALASGVSYAGVAFFSVALFLLRGKTATFAGVLNRVTSLLAGTGATLLTAFYFGTPWPSASEWGALVWVLAATALLARSELRRARETEGLSDGKVHLKLFTGGLRNSEH